MLNLPAPQRLPTHLSILKNVISNAVGNIMTQIEQHFRRVQGVFLFHLGSVAGASKPGRFSKSPDRRGANLFNGRLQPLFRDRHKS